MFSFKASHQNQGFTLIELVVVLFIAGTLAAIAVPSFLSMYERNQVNNAISTVQGALKEAQRESMRKSMVCNVTLSSTAITSSNGCLVTSSPTLSKVALASSLSAFRFDIRGNTISNTASTNLTTNVTILVSSTSNPKMVKCLVVSAPLGLIRTGKYPFSQVATPAEQYCTP
jgi:prepilin-type N-terminal cleavage/methylation domain-containing protein